MRALLLVAVVAVVGLVWPRAERRVRGPGALAVRTVAPVARAPQLAETPAAEGIEAPAPERPSGVETGPCALHLRLVDDTTGKGTASWVELWRLGVPETSQWTAGDQLQALQGVGVGGHVFRDLPPGRYRVLVYDHRSLAEDPPAFDVAGEATERTLFVAAPRTYRAQLLVFAETGAMVHRASQSEGLVNADHWSSTPDWARPRRLKNGGCGRRPDAHLSLSISGGLTRVGRYGERGFELGAFRGPGRRTEWCRSVYVAPRERSYIRVPIRGDCMADRTYVGVAVSLELLQGLVLLPGGGLARDAGASFRARSDAIPVDTAQPWQSVPVKVTVTLDGYEDLIFTYRVDRPPAMQVMQLTPVSEPH